ncbi:protein mono-ADP-ribosyltransferase PARP12-like [Eleutherodactylus coqui]|uniref:protein mono-ADP-ribosyltransferase PARP12-like n=1 Tax=Eleutherodactylus coqui TaxID=57060 RepID=UPI003461DC2D
MSDPTVKLLCKHGGRLPRKMLPELMELPNDEIDQILQGEPQKFPQVEGLVLARTAARICGKYLKNEPEDECNKLHLCRHYLQGRCWPNRRPPCRFSHDTYSYHNQLVLKANGISGLNDDEIKVLLLQNDNQLLRQVCMKYLHGTCDLGKDCSQLHICRYFIRGECNYQNCRFSHHLMEFCSDLLLGRCRMSEVSVQNFQMISFMKQEEHLQSRWKRYEKRNPAEQRGGERPPYRKQEDWGNVSQDRGREEERADQGNVAWLPPHGVSWVTQRTMQNESKLYKRSRSRLLSKRRKSLYWSGDEDDDDEPPQKIGLPASPKVSTQPGPSVSQEKPVMTPVASPYSAPPAVTAIRSVTSPPVLSCPTLLVDSPTKDPSAPQEKPVQSSVRSKPLPAEPDIAPVICLSNVWKHCKLGKLCPHLHYYLPYCWQIHKGMGWEDLSNMEEIERQYCDPKVDRIPMIDFLTMRSGTHRVRRLSTISSVEKPSEYVLTTEWLWYWRDEYGTWTQYGHSNVKQVSANILSSDFENIYLSDSTADITFIAGNQSYEINFREMKQKNLQHKTEKDVRRRPRFVSFEDVKLLKGSTKSAAAAKSPQKSGTSPLKTDIYPKTWQAGAMPEIGCQKVLVSATSSEFSKIVSNFTKTVSGHVVKRMWRLQNPSLWQVFQWQKEQMKKANQGRDMKEVRLFHGTQKLHVDAICIQNFDWRICGTHGTVYGQGSYFARDASYSHNYCTPTPSGTRMMFVARVLVGDYVVGNTQMKRPPQRPGSSTRFYDSCVDDVFHPSIFVVFEKHQIYPEYLLEYEEEQKKSCIIC